MQRDFIEQLSTQGRKKPFFILKGRQQGFTTLITALQLSHAILKKNFSGFTVADRDDNTKAIFLDKAKTMYSALPWILKPHEKLNSVNELFFDKLNSSWRIASASSNVGRSRTLSFIHFSETAFYKCPLSDLQKSIQESAIPDAIIIYETTANGFNDTKALWDSSACHNLFYEWWRTKEYVSDEYEEIEKADSWLRERLKVLKEKGLNKNQLAWYAKKYNSYIDKASIRQEYPCTPEEAFIVSGDCVFDSSEISNYLSSFNIKSKIGLFNYNRKYNLFHGENGEVISHTFTLENIEFEERLDGYISIVEPPYCKTENGRTEKKPYVIGADTSGNGKDYFTAKVIDNTTGKCVATLRKQRMDEDLFAEQLFCLGKYYNDAHIGVEINYSRSPVITLSKLGYENLYKSSPKGVQDKDQSSLGFNTNLSTRPIIISNLVKIMRENIRLETDRETLKELSTFVRTDSGRAEAATGSHDDLVMASAIAHFIAINYNHEMEIIDTGSDVLENFFTNPIRQSNEFIEW